VLSLQFDIIANISRDMEIHWTTHNIDCPRTMVYNYQFPYGFGCQLRDMLTCAVGAFARDRAFVLADNWMAGGYKCQVSSLVNL